MKRPLLALSLAGLLALVMPRSASADLILGFSAPTYTIASVGQTATVAVTLTQNAVGPQVGVGNALLSAAVLVTYVPANGIANLIVIGAPGWDALSNGPAVSPVDIAVLSLAGFTDLSGPLTIANLTFQGTGVGAMTLTVRQLDLTTGDFATELGNVADPTNTATATLIVGIPEPSPLGLGFLMLGAAAAIRRLRARRAA
ncbi:MAG: hypothetical protein AB7I30_20490 [Isosphaeraceae bacterium]